jgi:hypothetical protein
VFSLLGLLVFGSSLPAQSEGFVEDGYTYREGYWWLNSVPYSRTRIEYDGQKWGPTGWGRYGYYPQRYYYFQYTKVVDYKSNDWRSKFLDVVYNRNEADAYQRAIEALGLPNSFYAFPNRYGAYNQLVGNYGTSGNSVYGYSFDAYGTADETQAYQSAAALIRQAGNVYQNGLTGHQSLIESRNHGRERIAETLAVGKIVAEAFRAAKPPGEVHAQVHASQSQGNQQSSQERREERREEQREERHEGNFPGGPGPGSPGGQAQAGDARGALIAACIECHGDKEPKGNYRIKDHWNYPRERQREAGRRVLLPPNDKDHMPKGKGILPMPLVMELLKDR